MAASERQVAYGITNQLVMGLCVELVELVDGGGTDYMDAAAPLDVKNAHGTWSDENRDKLDEVVPRPEEAALRIDFHLVGSDATVDAYIDYDPGSAIHADFYGSRHDDALPSPRIVKLADKLSARMGLNRIYWDGRDSTADRRILLAGRYTLRLVARVGRVVRRASSALEIAPPHSWSIGLDVINKKDLRENSADAMRETGTKLRSLSDGTGYTGDASSANSAASVLANWANSAVAVFDGHSDPSKLMLFAREGGRPRGGDATNLRIQPPPPNSDIALVDGDAALSQQPSDVFKDMLLAILLGCRSGDNVVTTHRLIQALSKKMQVPINGWFDDRTVNGLTGFQIARGLRRTGEPDAETANALGVVLEGLVPTREELRDMQRSIKQWSNYISFPIEPHGTESEEDRAATFSLEFRRFQELAWLPQTGLADAATKERLQLAGEDQIFGENIAQEFMRRGCYLALGFPEYSYFGSAETWLTGFVSALASGASVEQAERMAAALVDPAYRASLRIRAYSRNPQSTELRIAPARYGATSQ